MARASIYSRDGVIISINGPRRFKETEDAYDDAAEGIPESFSGPTAVLPLRYKWKAGKHTLVEGTLTEL